MSLRVVLAAAWRRQPVREVDDDVLMSARALASRNLVEGPLLATYPERFPASVHRRMETLADRYWTNLAEVGGRLTASGVSAVLIKSGLEVEPSPLVRREALAPAAVEYGDLDLVVGADGWDRSIASLRSWGELAAPHPLEPGKVMVLPRAGPGAHLHRRASWFGIPVIPTARLRSGARSEPGLHGLLLPGHADALRLWLGHAVFQNLAFDLSELLHVRALAIPETIGEAAREAAAEGWGLGFRHALGVAAAAIDRLDREEAVRLPVPLPALPSLAWGMEHGSHLLRTRQWSVALRELAQRPMLVAAKQRRRLSA
jgi:hypothetical protein